MPVYVDNARLPYRKMIMCHMVADTHEELVEMADLIGVNRRWIQKEGTYAEHFDICLVKRNKAIKNGATVIDSRQLASILKRKRNLSG